MLLAMLIGVGTQEIILIALVVALLFGATRIPQLMKNLGVGIREFKSAIKEGDPPATEKDPEPDDQE
ncbi:twin-arginine translocase TatA/TatE family subunit [bacterium]|nr:twin-arginine translocase TatA/TatE family subunit [bacterium]